MSVSWVGFRVPVEFGTDSVPVSRHPMGSQVAVLLSKWLNDDPDHIAQMMGAGGTPSSLDWMMLALSGVGSQAHTKKIGEAFVEKMLAKGDIHAAATILISLGDEDDAIEVYVTRQRYLEAVLLACLLRPLDWQRQSYLVRSWGEQVVENSQQHLAIRCFSCTGVDSTDTWMSSALPNPLSAGSATNTASSLATGNTMSSIATGNTLSSIATGNTLSSIATGNSLSSATSGNTMSSAAAGNSLGSGSTVGFSESTISTPDHLATLKSMSRRPYLEAPTPIAMPAPPTPLRPNPPGTRMTTKNSALKLITSFEPQDNYKFPGLKSDDRTPTNAAGVTPIAESAIGESALTPGGLGSFRLNSARSISNAMLLKTAASGGFMRKRLPSIGETPVDVNPPAFPAHPAPKRLPTPADSGPEKGKDASLDTASTEQGGKTEEQAPLLLLTSARYEPKNAPKETPLTALAPTTELKFHSTDRQAPEPGADEPRSRNGSRGRKPEGLSIQMVPVEEAATTTGEALPPSTYADMYKRTDTAASFSTTQGDSRSDMTSPPTTGNGYRSLKSPSTSGRSLDKYISSLEQAQYYERKQHSHPHRSRERRGKDDHHERKRSKHRQTPSDGDRGRTGRRTIPAANRSPSSPVPMSPEDVSLYSASMESLDTAYGARVDAKARDKSSHSGRTNPKVRSESKGERRRQRSGSRHADGRSKASSRTTSRRHSPDPPLEISRGRKESRRGGSRLRSPSSPLPMSASGEDLRKFSDPDAALRLVSDDRRRGQRSKSRRPERGTSACRDPSPDRRKPRTRSTSRRPEEPETGLPRKYTVTAQDAIPNNHRNDLNPPSELESNLGTDSVASTPNLGTGVSATPEAVPDRRRKELAAAELEARRLSLARRPSAPAIPFPSHLTPGSHGKSQSVGTGPAPLARAYTDTSPQLVQSSSFTGRMLARHSPTEPTHFDSGSSGNGSSRPRKGLPCPPRAMKHPEFSTQTEVPDVPDNLVTLTASVYQPDVIDIPRSMSAPVPDFPPTVPPDLPMHPAYDCRVPQSRSSSKGREQDFSPRGQSRDRGKMSPRDIPVTTIGTAATGPSGYQIPSPPVLPELQHLALPPPPPPPPPSMAHHPSSNTLPSMTQVLDAHEPLPPPSVSPNHRRGRSGNDHFVDKIKSITGRLRSTSRGRHTQSPSSAASENPSPYESIPIQNYQPAGAVSGN